MVKNNFVSCGKCKNGYIYTSDCVQECNCRIEWSKKERFIAHFNQSELPKKILDYEINQYIGKDQNNNIGRLKKYILNFHINKTYNLFLWSKQNSTQKTTIANWIGKELVKKGFSVFFINMDNLVQLLIDGQFKEEIKEKIQDLLNIDFLIVDDCFDCAKVQLYKSGYQISYIDSFFRVRLEKLNKATCFTSNISIEEISISWGLSLQELFNRNILYPMNFVDRVDKKDIIIQVDKNYNIFQ